MRPIQLVCASSLISNHDGLARQELTFRMLVQNIAADKTVEVHWAGEDGHWRVLPANFHYAAGLDREIWQAQMNLPGPYEGNPLPGDVAFALHCRSVGRDVWDNNHSENYKIKADWGLRLVNGCSLLHADFQPRLRADQGYLPIAVAACPPAAPKRVFVRWTTDRWRTSVETPCFFLRRHWHTALGGSVCNPNRYGTSIWISHLRLANSFRAEYAIGCEMAKGTLWDNNFGQNYIARLQCLKVLTLNLHCNQEDDQDAKLSQIARAIRDLDIDIVCFQEVAEPWNNGKGEWSANTANVIRERIGGGYQLHSDWSHQGFGRYRESCAILSRFEFSQTDSGYVSASQDAFDINSRRVVMAQVRVPHIGKVNVFSAHLSWWDGGFKAQFEKLRQWADARHTGDVEATLLCGDFNVAARSEAYAWVLGCGDFEDQFLAGGLRAVQSNEGRWAPDDGRIDFIFLRKGGRLEAVASRELFTDASYGRVSDHSGYCVEFEPK